ncbi:MAG: hypothetical protein CUN55_02235 [Phototrophicales bacterium]|nr:MAG: hypothetical protein CUN55_02235 [Phototrophicales bacterium]
MFRTRVRKILRDVWSRKGRTALVSIAIFIGVAGTIALFSLSDILISQLEEDIKPEELAMIDVNVSLEQEDLTFDNAAYLAQLRAVDGVTGVEGFAANSVYFSKDPETTTFRDLEEAFFYGYDIPFEQIQIEPMRLVEGDYPRGGEQIAVEKRFAEKYGVSIGDTLYFRVLSGDTTNSVLEPRTISGIVFHPYIFEPDAAIYGSIEDSNYFSGLTGYSNFVIRVESYPAQTDEAAQDAFDALVDQIETIIEATPYTVQFTATEDPENNDLVTSVQTITGLLSTLALVALVVSGFLVINVITSLVTEQRNQIGVMKALGATRLDNFFIYSGIAFMYGLIGVIPGIIVGIPIGYIAAKELGPELNTLVDGFRISPPSIILGSVVGLAVPVIASVIPVFNGTRVTILEAMTDLGIDAKYGTGPIAKLIAALPFPIAIRQGLANLSLKKVRLLFTVLTLTVAVGSFIGIYGVFDAIRSGIGSYLDSFNTEIGLAVVEARDPQELTDTIRREFGEENGGFITSIEPGYFIEVDFITKDGEKYEPSFGAGGPPAIFAYGIDPLSDDAAFVFTVDEGERWTPENTTTGIILTGALARGLDVGVGDTVTIAVPGAKREMEVIAISEYPIDQAYINWEVLAEMRGSRYIPPEERVPEVVDNEYFTPIIIEGYEGLPLFNGAVPALGINTQLADLLEFVDGELFALEENQVVISASLAESANLSVGDSITVASTIIENSDTYTIAGIFETPRFLAGDGNGRGMPQELVLFYTPKLAALNGIDLPEGVLYPQLFFLKTNLDNPTADEIADKISDMEERFLELGERTFTFNFIEFQEQFTSTLLQIQIILSSVASLIALVGALGLLTTLSMSVYERQKEIGVMRSIGGGSFTIAFQFLTEGLVVGVLAWLIGLPVAIVIQWILFNVTGFGDTFAISFPIDGAILGLVGVLFFTALASFGPSLSAARRTVSDILRYQ